MLNRRNKKPIVTEREQLALNVKARCATIRKKHAAIKVLRVRLDRAKDLENDIKMALETDMLNHADDRINAIKTAFKTHEKEIPAAKMIQG